jgi:hypothetical protein
VSLDDLPGRGVASSADQLVLQVGGAHAEAKCLHTGAGHAGAGPGPLDSAPEAAFRTVVTQASYPGADPVRAQQVQEAAGAGRTAHRHHADAPAAGHLAAPLGERLRRGHVAHSPGQHDRLRPGDAGQIDVHDPGNSRAAKPPAINPTC